MPHTINFDDILFPDNKYLHKENKENIHIYNLRRSLPRVIISEIFEKDILPQLNMDDKEFMLSCYIKKKIIIGDEESGGDADAYVLRSLPISFSIETMESILKEPQLSEVEKKFILGCYKKRINENNYILSCDISELDELRIANILQIRWLLVNDADKKRISDIFERINQFQKNDIFIANMHIDPTHEYFFEHKLDHVPGMMAIETARQVFLACAHIYGKVPTQGVFFTLNAMNVSFSEYLWMSYPIRIILRMSNTSVSPEGYWHKCSCSVSFYQEFREKANVSVEGMTIKKEIIEGIIVKKQIERALEFDYSAGLQTEVLLKDAKNDMTIIGRIVDISPKHVMVEFIEDTVFDSAEEFDFRISLEKQYYCYGVCILLKSQRKGNRTIANFYLLYIDSSSANNINEIIKRLCHLREQKGIL